jgi:Fur family ferric uptake transcriptional regulator
MENEKTLESTLRDHGLKATPTRLKILKLLAKSQRPLAGKDIFRRLGAAPGQGRFDTVTVYRNLSLFEKAGLIAPIQLKDGILAYEFMSERFSHHHHHFVCEDCGTIEHLDLCGLDIPTQTLAGRGYKNIHHRLEFFGLCPQCG